MNNERTCIGCRKVSQKGQLLRIVRSSNGSIAVDRSGKLPGRGTYVCSMACLEKALEHGKLSSALRARVDVEISGQVKAAAQQCFSIAAETVGKE